MITLTNHTLWCCLHERWGCSRLLRTVWAENKQSLTTHSTVMAERDRFGKQAVTSKGAAGLYKKTSNPWQPIPQLWQSVIDWENKLSRPRVLPVRTKKQAILDDPLHSYGRAWSIGKASCHVQGCCRFVRKNKQSLMTHSTVMTERDRSGKQAVTSKGAAGSYQKTSNPWRPIPQLWQSVIDRESKLSRPRMLQAADPSIVKKRQGGCLFGGSRQRMINSRNYNNEVL